MSQIHWLGAGLSSVPGIRRLASAGNEMILWNRTLAKAQDALGSFNSTATTRVLDWGDLKQNLNSGDVVVSMLPANMHLQVAQICLEKQSHFVSSSYVSPEMKALSTQAAENDLCFVNEVGLDPGLDHLLAHVLMHNYRTSDQFDTTNEHHFRSYCGGFPLKPNDFKYKFSWSPLGVLRALKSPAQWISGGSVQTTEKPWKSLQSYLTRLPDGEEVFQAYPNRDSLPFMEEYGFGSDWNVQEFVRGTLRLDGWSSAWADIFELVEGADGEAGQQALTEKSDQLWQEYRYDDGESDRVVLSVDLEVRRDGEPVWHQTYCLDEAGNDKGSAMARLVSLTSSIAVEAVLAGEIESGVSAAPKRLETVDRWLQQMTELGETFRHFDIV